MAVRPSVRRVPESFEPFEGPGGAFDVEPCELDLHVGMRARLAVPWDPRYGEAAKGVATIVGVQLDLEGRGELCYRAIWDGDDGRLFVCSHHALWPLRRPDAKGLAARFCALVREELDAVELDAVHEMNLAWDRGGGPVVCATTEFMDSFDAMNSALRSLGSEPSWGLAWLVDEAWGLARSSGFSLVEGQ